MLCEDCSHNEVCSYKEDYKKFIEQVNMLNQVSKFEAEPKCKHFLNKNIPKYPAVIEVIKQPSCKKPWEPPWVIGDALPSQVWYGSGYSGCGGTNG